MCTQKEEVKTKIDMVIDALNANTEALKASMNINQQATTPGSHEKEYQEPRQQSPEL